MLGAHNGGGGEGLESAPFANRRYDVGAKCPNREATTNAAARPREAWVDAAEFSAVAGDSQSTR